MDVIYAYLDTMFSPYASSPRLDAAKEELRGMMEDAYSARIAQGNSHNEAVGAVITEFGNLDELAEVLGISTELSRASGTRRPDDAARAEPSPSATPRNSDDAAAQGAATAGAHVPHAAPPGAEPRSSAAAFTAGSTSANPAASDFAAPRSVRPEAGAAQAQDPCDNRSQWWNYGRMWGGRDGMPSSRVEILASIFWPVITAIFLLWSFIGDAWHISWLIWPVAGVLFGPIVIIFSAWSNRRDKRGNGRTS